MKSSTSESETAGSARTLRIRVGSAYLEGELNVSANAPGVVIFAHGSGSSRHSPRNQFVARVIRQGGCGTLLFDLLTAEEEIEDNVTGQLRFDISLLAKRLAGATDWLVSQTDMCNRRIGYFGSSTGGGAALVAAAAMGRRIGAVVSRGGRPDLAGESLPRVQAPTLLIVGEYDDVVIRLNEDALRELRCEKQLKIVRGATHLFGEPGALDEVARLASDWFSQHLRARAPTED